MALVDNYSYANNPIVVAQVTAAIYAAAANVYAESTAVTGHVNRALYATEVVNGRINLQPLIYLVVAFAALTPASTDTAVNNAVAAQWSLFAGA